MNVTYYMYCIYIVYVTLHLLNSIINMENTYDSTCINIINGDDIDDIYVWNNRDKKNIVFSSEKLTKKSIIYGICGIIETYGNILFFERDRKIMENIIEFEYIGKTLQDKAKTFLYGVRINLENINNISILRKLQYSYNTSKCSDIQIGVSVSYFDNGYAYGIVLNTNENGNENEKKFEKGVHILMKKNIFNDYRFLRL